MAADWWLNVWIEADNQGQPYLMRTFLFLSLGAVVTSFARAFLFFTATLKASSTLHHRSITKVRLFFLFFSSFFFFFFCSPTCLPRAPLFSRPLCLWHQVVMSPMDFFTSNPLGRIINRFSSDLSQMDEQLAVALFDTLQIACMAAGSVLSSFVHRPSLMLSIKMLSLLTRAPRLTIDVSCLLRLWGVWSGCQICRAGLQHHSLVGHSHPFLPRHHDLAPTVHSKLHARAQAAR